MDRTFTSVVKSPVGQRVTRTFSSCLILLLLASSTLTQAQTGPGGVGNADGSGGQPENIIWLDAKTITANNGANVLSWLDASGNERHAGPSEAGSSGLPTLRTGSFNYLEFNQNENDRLVINPLDKFPNTEITTFILYRTNDSGEGILSYDVSGGGNEYLLYNSGNLKPHVRNNGKDANVSFQGNTWTILDHAWRSSDGSFTVHKDGNQVHNSLYQQGSTMRSGGSLAIGSEQDGVDGGYNTNQDLEGDIAEVIIFNNYLTTVRRILVQNYLSSKYSIPLSTNDVYAGEANGYLHQVTGIGRYAGDNHTEARSGGFALRMNNTTSFTDNEFILAGHSNIINTSTTSAVGGAAQERWARSWFVDITGQADVEITFDLRSEGINNPTPGSASDYVLLYRNTTTGNFSIVTGTSASINGSRISFPVANLTNDGYYTLGSTNQTDSPVTGVAGKIWYTLKSGNWTDPTVWTLDGGVSPAQQPVGGGVPDVADRVVITNGKNVKMVDNNRQVVGATIFGTLDMANTTGHNVIAIDGDGRIDMAGSPTGLDNFPAGDASAFSAAGKGTVRLYGSGITLNQPRTFNNLEVYMSNNSNLAILLNDITLRGSLYINTGNFRINDNNATTRRRFNIAGDVTVDNGAAMSVGTGNAYANQMGGAYGDYHESFHTMYVKGDFTNHGQIRFTNQTQPDYDSPTNTGAVSLVFTGAANRTFNCNGVTDLYNLVIDKGNSQTYELVVNASAKNHFSLFGQNDDDWNNADAANPEMQKALWIKNGTLRLTGKVYIPTLTEGSRDWTIGENAALVLDDPEVFVASTARTNGNTLHSSINYTGLSYTSAVGFDNGNGNQGIYINGTLRINDGFFTTGYSHGLVYRAESPSNRLEINGGEVRAGQFRISGSANPATAKMSYLQTGGTLRLVDNRTNAAIFDLSAGLSSFNISGGQIILEDLSDGGINAINIASPSTNINVTGGEVIINNTTGDQRTARISTTAPFYNFTLQNNRDREVQLATPLTIINDILIQEETFNANSQDLTVRGDMTVANTGAYVTGNNTTRFVGNEDSEIRFDNTTTTQVIHHLALDKSNTTLALNIEGSLSVLQINGDLTVIKGELRHGNQNIHAQGNVNNEGIIGASSIGQLVLNGATRQTITANQGLFHKVTIDNINSVSTTTDVAVANTLTLTNGVLDISTHKLKLQGKDATFVTPSTFDNTRMVQTAGNASDGGLEMYVDANETLLFPIGTNANGVSRYTPARAILTNVLDDGYVQVTVADQILYTTNPVGDALSYYWRTNYREFNATGLPTVQYEFTYANSDIVGTVTNYVAGKVSSEAPYTRSGEDFEDTNVDGDILDLGEGSANIASVNETSNTLTFNYNGLANTGFRLEKADYTAGEVDRFVSAPTVYYNTNTGRANWTSGAKWTRNINGTDDGINAYPGVGDIAIIQSYGQNNDNAWVNGNIDISIAKLLFNNSAGGYAPRLWVTKRDASLDLGQVEGAGTLYLEVTAAQTPTFSENTDLGFFSNEAGSTFNFKVDEDNQIVNLPNNVSVYPRLRIEGGDGDNDDDNRILQTSIPITVNRDIRMDRSCRFRINHDIIIKEDLRITWQGNRTTFEIGDSQEVTVDVGGDLTLENGQGNDDSRILVKNDNRNSYEHTLKVGGDIVIENVNNSSAFDLYNGTAPNNNATLELSGAGNYSFTNASSVTPDLYRVVMNKGVDTASTFIFHDRIVLNGPTAGVDKALTLENGLVIFDDPAIEVVLANNSPVPFFIPSTAGIESRQGQLKVNGNAGILLDGLLRISNTGHLDMGCSSCGNHRYIEYGSSGNATIEVLGGWLDVGSQIRRSPTNDAGVLKFRQTGGDVSVGRGGSTPYANRGMLEVLNAGSEFTLTGGNFTIYQQNGNNPTVAALILNPETYDLTGSTINLGGQANLPNGNANNFNPANQNNMGIDASIPLNDLVIRGYRDTPARIVDKALTVGGNLTIENEATLDASGLSLTLLGNMNVNNNFIASGNETIFNGSNAQQVNGSADFYNLTKHNVSTLSLTNAIQVDHNLTITAGTLNDGGNTITLYGDMTVDGTHSSGPNGGGVVFAGSSQQLLSRSSAGNSNIGRITIDNPTGVVIPEGDGYSFTVQRELRLSQGVFKIGSNLLVLATNAEIAEVNPFSTENMIETNKSASDAGVQKLFAANRTTDFIFPVGQGKYTPVQIDLSSQANYTFGNTAGSLRVAPVNEYHPTIPSDNGDKTTPDDLSNVLQYYWLVDADNVGATFKGKMTLEYQQEDVLVADANYAETDYITAVLRSDNNPNEDITKGSGVVNPTNNTLDFVFDGVTDAGISGDYFAGIDLAIPDRIPVYTTVQSGNVDAAIYDKIVSGGIPNGAIVIVDTEDVLTFNQENVRFYRTEIRQDATLDLANTSIHTLGKLTGTGTLRVENDASLGMAEGSNFFDCGQGKLEYSGTNKDYSVLASLPRINEVAFTGSGIRRLPNNDVVICDSMTVAGPAVRNESNRRVTILGNTYLTSGSFETGTGDISHRQNLHIDGGTYLGQNGGQDSVYNNFIVEAGTFNGGNNGTMTLLKDLTYSGGTFTGGTGTARVRIGGTTPQTISGNITGTNRFNQLEMNNSAGLSIANNVDVAGALVLTKGLITPDVAAQLKLTASATTSTGKATSYVNGKLYRDFANGVAGTLPFPVGKYDNVSGTGRWGNISVSSPSGTGTWNAEYFNHDPSDDGFNNDDLDTDVDSGIEKISQLEYWALEGPSPGTARVHLRWDAQSDVSTAATERDNLRVMQWNSQDKKWNSRGNSNMSGNSGYGSLRSNSSVNFSKQYFTLGSTSETNALPVELVTFQAEAQEKAVLLTWETASEINNDFFEVQRSLDGQAFEKIGEVAGQGSSNETHRYQFIDKQPLEGTVYYRLKQVDYDGLYDYSDLVAMEWTYSAIAEVTPITEVLMFPNPSEGGIFTLRIHGMQRNTVVSIKLIDMVGKVHLQKRVEAESLAGSGLRVSPSGSLPAGLYFVNIQQGNHTFQEKLIVR